MPPLEVLALPSYQWNHSAAEVQSSWDFSHLTSLDIRGVPLYAFLSTVPFASFVHLRVLKIGDMAWSKKEECRSEGFLLLDQFLSGLRNLEELYLSSQTRGLSLKTFSCLPKLKILECREAVLVGGAVERGIRFNTEQLAQLREYCPYIRELAIDMDIVSTEVGTFPAELPFSLSLSILCLSFSLSMLSNSRECPNNVDSSHPTSPRCAPSPVSPPSRSTRASKPGIRISTYRTHHRPHLHHHPPQIPTSPLLPPPHHRPAATSSSSPVAPTHITRCSKLRARISSRPACFANSPSTSVRGMMWCDLACRARGTGCGMSRGCLFGLVWLLLVVGWGRSGEGGITVVGLASNSAFRQRWDIYSMKGFDSLVAGAPGR